MANSALAIGKAPYRVFRARLSNGLAGHRRDAPPAHRRLSASTCALARATRRRETNGLSHFVEHMLFRGSSQFPDSFALNRAIEELGGTLYAETGRDYSLYQIPLQPAALPRGLAILGDLFSTPAFRDIDLERQIILEEILEDLDDRGRNVNVDDLSRLAAWDEHPLGYTITGPLKNVRRFHDADVRRHFERFYGAANMVLCVAGPLRHARASSAGARGLRARAARASGARRSRRARPGRARASARSTTSRRRRRCRSCFTRCPRPTPTTRRCARSAACSTTACRRALHYQICDQKGLAYSVAGQPALVPRRRAPRDRRRLRARQAAGARQRVARDPRALPRRARQRGRARQGQAPLLDDLEACYDDPDSLCGWFGGTELFMRARARRSSARASSSACAPPTSAASRAA